MIFIISGIGYLLFNRNCNGNSEGNEIPPLQISGKIQEKKKNGFYLTLSENVEDLNESDVIEVVFSKQMFDGANSLLKDSDIQLYIDNLSIGESLLILSTKEQFIMEKQLELNRVSNIIQESH